MITTNKWSCVLDSFSHCIGLEPQELINEIGHDGTNTGFHTQELIIPLINRGYSVTEIHRKPIAVHPYTGEQRLITFGTNQELSFATFLDGHNGVLLGYNQKRQPHVVSWKQNKLHDPAGYTALSCELLSRDSENYLVGICDLPSFTPTKFLRISKIT